VKNGQCVKILDENHQGKRHQSKYLNRDVTVFFRRGGELIQVAQNHVSAGLLQAR
jgi:hypothetical protein